ncbi:response regulator [Rubripirellula sp.]|nr:response regulator [Rubripirellula sp.]MDF1844073.1 response regulator [Rubripirellula sp.]
MKALVVDDSGVMRRIISRGLNSLWVNDVAEASDGLEAIEVFGDGAGFDLILTDWNMPKVNGLDFVQSIRNAGRTLPIIMVTTETEKEQVVRAIQAGVNDDLIKPFDQEMLRLKLERVIPNPKA